jgi:hypothetical protein
MNLDVNWTRNCNLWHQLPKLVIVHSVIWWFTKSGKILHYQNLEKVMGLQGLKNVMF